jgi:glycosyltransferase involved in cell wall biosynthesis
MSTFQHKRFIRQAIEGVMMQQVKGTFELVIGDDCSDDGTRTVCEEMQQIYGAKINLLPSDKKYGQSENLTRIIQACKGKYVAVCEGDDYWIDPLKLQKQVEFLDVNPDCILCFHRVHSVDENGNYLEVLAEEKNVKVYKSNQLVHTFMPTLSMFFRNCLNDFPVEFYHVKSTDAFLVALLARYGNGADLGFIGGCYRKHSGGLYNQLDDLRRYQQSIHTRKLMKNCAAFDKDQQLEIRRELWRRQIMYLKIFIKKGQLLNCFRLIVFYVSEPKRLFFIP